MISAHPDDEIIEHWEGGHILVRRPDGMVEVRWSPDTDERERVRLLEARLTSMLNARRDWPEAAITDAQRAREVVEPDTLIRVCEERDALKARVAELEAELELAGLNAHEYGREVDDAEANVAELEATLARVRAALRTEDDPVSILTAVDEALAARPG